jgi:hypothetical protein
MQTEFAGAQRRAKRADAEAALARQEGRPGFGNI